MHQKIADLFASLLSVIYAFAVLSALLTIFALAGDGPVLDVRSLVAGGATLVGGVLVLGIFSVVIAMREDLRAIRKSLEERPKS